VAAFGKNFAFISTQIGIGVTPTQCYCRYRHLCPKKTPPWREDEDQMLLDKYRILGPEWGMISQYFPGRRWNQVKCRVQLLNRRRVISASRGEDPHVVPIETDELFAPLTPLDPDEFNFPNLQCDELGEPFGGSVDFSAYSFE
jgi:hypothetical protein